MTLEQLVEDMVREHGGGTRFFDSLDKKLRTNAITCALTVVANAMFGQKKTVVSGRFGAEYGNQFFPCLVLPSLRRGDFTAFPQVEAEGEYVFLDDSFYSGRTYDTARIIVSRGGGKIIGAVVAYDGSPKPWRSVYSLYRWRDRT